jgi:hypothetical protein
MYPAAGQVTLAVRISLREPLKPVILTAKVSILTAALFYSTENSTTIKAAKVCGFSRSDENKADAGRGVDQDLPAGMPGSRTETVNCFIPECIHTSFG